MLRKIPFQIVELEGKSYHIVVEGKIGDKEITLIVDTGASRTIFDSSFASTMSKTLFGNDIPIATGLMAEQIPVEMIAIPCLTLAKHSFENINALTADLSAINVVYNKITGKKIDGLIGCDFLLDHIKSIDFKKRCLVLLEERK